MRLASVHRHVCFSLTDELCLMLLVKKQLFTTRGRYQCEGRCPRKVCDQSLRILMKSEGMAMKARAFVQWATNADKK
jgi:hypothetical protein